MRAAIAIVVGLAFILSPRPASGQRRPPASSTSRDLEGVWEFSTLTPLQRPARFAEKPYLTPEEAAAFERELRAATNNDRRGETADADLMGPGINEVWMERGALATVRGRVSASLIVDPSNGLQPSLSPAAEQRIAARRALGGRADQPEDRSLSERCLRAVSGPPFFPSPDANTIRIIQSPDYIAITQEKFHDTRIVPMSRTAHVASTIRHWVGDSRGHWDHDVLVVDTTNFTSRIGATGMFDGNLHLTERFTRSDAHTLLYEVSIDDPSVFGAVWTVALPMRRISGPLYEFACHEGNYSLPNILRGARALERQAQTTEASR